MSGSPPAIDTTGAPHSSMAATAVSTVMRCLRMFAGYWIFPHPAHARLHANSGSSSTTSGNFSRFRSFCFIRYAPTRACWRKVTAISSPPGVRSIHRTKLDGQRELQGLLDYVALANGYRTEPRQRVHHPGHQGLGGAGPGGDPDRVDTGQPRWIQLGLVVEELGRAAHALADLDQALRI